MPTVTIDGRRVTVREGAYVLEAARLAGVRIPTLCHHDAVEPFGGCRLCVVDIWKPGWDADWFRLVVACLYPVEEGLVVHTATPRVVETRRVVLDLLLARCPETPLIRDLAREYGIEETTYRKREKADDCILCGLCYRICDKVGPAAISAQNRGVLREVGGPFVGWTYPAGPATGRLNPPPDCIGCLACAEVCPTGHIQYREDGFTRTIWGKTFQMLKCPSCGRAHITRAQAEWLASRGMPVEPLCDSCKQRRTAQVAASLGKPR